MRGWRDTIACFSLGCALCAPLAAWAQDDKTIAAAVIRVDYNPPLPISRLDRPPEDLGFAGGALATSDNMTTGGFLGQTFTVEMVEVPPDGAVAALEDLLGRGVEYVAVMAGGADTLALADAAGDRALILNALAPDDSLRNADCRANMAHIAPSRSMQTDAVAQFVAWKRWSDWLLIEGSHPGDTALADAYRNSATKFGAEIVEARVFEDTGGARRTDSGLVQVQAQMPVFTQSAPEHDVLVTADENEVFAGFVPYHTWDPRPVVGSSGLRPVTWHPAMEAWGRRNCRRASRNRRAAACARRITTSGWRCAPWARRRPAPRRSTCRRCATISSAPIWRWPRSRARR